MYRSLQDRERRSDDSHTLSIADMMSGLMVIFLFIALSYMLNVTKDRARMTEIAESWAETKVRIYDELSVEFSADLQQWNAEIEKEDLVVRFREPTVLFGQGNADLTPRFREILRDFFPRYVDVLYGHREAVAEVRIEGHTSSEWAEDTTPHDAYFLNMELSQDRTRSVLYFGLNQIENAENRGWTQNAIVAAGMSSSRLIRRDSTEDADASRRVEFRVITNAETQLSRILDESSK